MAQDVFKVRGAWRFQECRTGETYFDLLGRDPGELQVAVAIARKGKLIKDKSKGGQKQSLRYDRGELNEEASWPRDKAREPQNV